MKKGILLMILAISTSVVFAQKQKIGHIDIQQIMQSLFIKDSVETKYMEYQTMLQGELQRLQNNLVREEQELTQLKDSIPEEIFNQRVQRLMKDQKEFQEETYPSMQQSLQNKMQALQIPLEEEINAAIEKVAKANGYTYILRMEATFYAGGPDITKLVRVALGLPEEPEELPMGGMPGAGMPGTGMPMGR